MSAPWGKDEWVAWLLTGGVFFTLILVCVGQPPPFDCGICSIDKIGYVGYLEVVVMTGQTSNVVTAFAVFIGFLVFALVMGWWLSRKKPQPKPLYKDRA